MYNSLNTGRGWGAWSYKIYNNPRYFLTFGGGHDFFIQPSGKNLQNNAFTFINSSKKDRLVMDFRET